MVGGRRIVAAWLALGLLGGAARGEEAPAPLARYAPAEKLIAYFEFDGLKAHQEGWKKTAARKALVETKLGELLEDLGRQGLDAIAKNEPKFRPARDAVAPLLAHVKDEGFAVAAFGDPDDPHFVAVARGGHRPEVVERLRQAGAPVDPPAGKGDAKAGRTIHRDAPDSAWWAEGDDLVFADPEGVDAVLAALDGKAPNAVGHPSRAALAKPEGGFEPVAAGFVDVAALPPMPPDAVELGLDGVKRVELRWGFQDDALVTTARLVAPAPRRGILALLDQPTFGIDSLPPIPASQHSFAALSIELARTYEKVAGLVKANDPASARKLEEFEATFRARLGLDLRAELLPLLGPKAAVYLMPVEVPDMDFPDPRMAGFLAYAGLVVSVEAKDEKAVAERLEKLIPTINAAVAAQARNLPRPPQFVREKGEGVAYVLDLKPLNLPPFLADLFSPTIAVGGGQLVISPGRDGVRLAVAAGSTPDKAWKPTEKFVPLAEALPAGMLLLGVDDVRDSIPIMIENLPQLAAVANAQIAQQAGRDEVFIDVDPAKVPPADQLRPLLFPASMAFAVDDEGVLYRQRESLPSVTSPATSAVLIALLLPAVQSAREAARRAQCVNNQKQIALAFHNFHSANDAFPGDIVGKDGKPLLSWRVAILPYIEQQELYNKFKLDEPWDSPHNKPLLAEMPRAFLCPSRPPGDKAHAHYQGFAGPHAMLEPGRKVPIQDVTDGTSNTVLVVESSGEVPWTKPDDLPFDPAAAPSLYGAGSKHPGGFNATFADGSVHFLKTTIRPEVLKNLITRDGGEVIGPGDF